MLPNPSDKDDIDFEPVQNLFSAINEYFPELLNQPDFPENIYHYTNLDGLYGIVKNRDLWLTHANYLNDEGENKVGYEILRTVIDDKEKVSKDSDKIEYLTALKQYFNERNSANIYICCFCGTDNLLSQWRTYGANGTGVSIQFDSHFNFDTDPSEPISRVIRLWKISYEPVYQYTILDQIIEFCFAYYSTTADRINEAYYYFDFYIPTFKAQDFKEENEWRLIFRQSTDYGGKCKFRIAHQMLIPYYSLNDIIKSIPNAYYKFDIKGIRVGPNPHKELNAESIRMLLQQENYQNVKVECSDTRYRP